ncbi:hypothetical protein JCM11641_005287 [Rhodosporidiobolus odoratus]
MHYESHPFSAAAAGALNDVVAPPFNPYGLDELPFSTLSMPPDLQGPCFDPSRLSPRSRAHSTSSSVSSVASSIRSTHSSFYNESPSTSHGARPSLELPSAKLQPGCDATGFAVDVPGSGQWNVDWSKLVDLLLLPDATRYLPQNHIVSELAGFLAARLQQGPSQHARSSYSTLAAGVNVVNDNFDQMGLQDGIQTSGESPFLFQVPGAPEVPVSDSYYALVPPATSRRKAPEPLRRSGTFVTPLQQAFAPPIDQHGLPTALPSLFQTTESVSSHHDFLPDSSATTGFRSSFSATTTPLSAHPPSQLPSLHESKPSHDGLSLRPATLAATRHLRNSTSPYARRPSHIRNASQTSVSTTSSLREGSLSSRDGIESAAASDYGETSAVTAGGVVGASAAVWECTSTKSKPSGVPKRNLKPLNRHTEQYLWVTRKGQLSRIPSGMDAEEVQVAEPGSELVVFPPGSYYKVVQDDLEILPCDSKARVNEWLRGQACVEKCTFRFEGKRPSVIRHHVVGCKTRQVMLKQKSGDPLKRLCQLQLDAQNTENRLKHARKAAENNTQTGGDPAYFPSQQYRPLPPDPPPSATLVSVGDDGFDGRSVLSVDSQHSSGSSFYADAGLGGKALQPTQAYWTGHRNSTGGSPLCQGSSSQSSGYTPPGNAVSERAAQAFFSSHSGVASSSLGLEGIPAIAEARLLPQPVYPSWLTIRSRLQDGWLASYGLTAPTGSDASHYLQVPPTGAPGPHLEATSSSSFLSMDEYE